MKLRDFDSHIFSRDIGITIGSFDGVHKGHQFLLQNFSDRCKEMNLAPVVISFSPHPGVFIGKKENYLLDSSHKKRELLKKFYSIDFMEIEFDESIMRLSGEEFFDSLLELMPRIKLLYAGHDFGLGLGKKFDYNAAKNYLSALSVVQENEYKENDYEISSTEIRELLKLGELKRANQLLGHIFKITATVVHGNKIGRTLGFPTANLLFDKAQILPVNGVYQSRCTIKGKSYRSIVNIGTRPTVTDDKTRVVEVNIFDFNEEIYQEIIDLEFYSKIRDEVKFSSKDALIAQIQLDKLKCSQSPFYGAMALIGRDILHSKSSAVYKKLLSNDYIDYTLLDQSVFPASEMKSVLKRYPYISITAPFKENAFKVCDLIENNFLNIESVNTLKLDCGKIIGINTDALAINQILKEYTFLEKEIFVLGDGAMSSIVEKVLISLKINFTILSRRKNNLDQLSQIKSQSVFIINTTSREFTPVLNDECEGEFWDLNYDQKYSQSLVQNKKIKYYDGHELLTRQAKFALTFWNLKSL